MKTVCRLMIVVGALVAPQLAPQLAKADNTGYVCSVQYVPTTSGTAGSLGFVQASFYSEPYCAGSQLATRYYCSTGATSSNCNTAAYIYSSRDTLLFLAERLHQAAISGAHVTEVTTSDDKPYYVRFYGN